MDIKGTLHESLRTARAANLRKLAGLDEYGLRRPMTPTGTNLLGVVKHLTGMEHGYLGETFGRSLGEPLPGDEDLWNGADMWARAEESSAFILGWYGRACAHADETIRQLDLDAPGAVPHWPEERRATTLGAMILLVLGEENRHGGHIDVVRELVDGRGGDDHEGVGGEEQWREYRARVQSAADAFRDD